MGFRKPLVYQAKHLPLGQFGRCFALTTVWQQAGRPMRWYGESSIFIERPKAQLWRQPFEVDLTYYPEELGPYTEESAIAEALLRAETCLVEEVENRLEASGRRPEDFVSPSLALSHVGVLSLANYMPFGGLIRDLSTQTNSAALRQYLELVLSVSPIGSKAAEGGKP